MNYSEKLKDPRWQKKRLEILQRDNWSCANCEANNKPLHVHHFLYLKGKEPWEYENRFLVSLCDVCHTDQENADAEFESCFALLSAREKISLARQILRLSKDHRNTNREVFIPSVVSFLSMVDEFYQTYFQTKMYLEGHWVIDDDFEI